MSLSKRLGVDPAGVAAGVGAAYATKIGLLFAIAQYRIFFTSHPPDIHWFSLDFAVTDLPFGRWILHGALVLGAAVGGYVAASYWYRRPLLNGATTGAVLTTLQVTAGVFRTVARNELAWEHLVVAAAVFVAALYGAKAGAYRRQSWERQCDRLDPWKQPPPRKADE